MKKHIRILSLCAGLLLSGIMPWTLAAGQSATELRPEIAFEGIPANWNYYFLSPEQMAIHTGEAVSNLCLDDDFKNNAFLFKNLQDRGPIPGTDGPRRTLKYKLLHGGVHFVVIAKDKVVVSTPHSGTHMIKTGYCPDLDTAKTIRFDDYFDRSVAQRCMDASVTFLTRRTSGAKTCAVESLHKWSGPSDIRDLKPETKSEPRYD